MSPLPSANDALDARRVQLIELIANTLPALLEGGFDHHLVKPVDLAALQRITDATGAHGVA